MSETWPITDEGSVVIRQYSPVDFKSLNKVFYNWALENNYKYNESFTEKAKSHGKEFEIVWRFEKKVTEFVMYEIHVAIWAYGMNPIKIDNKELMQGNLEIVFNAYIILDWQNRSEFSKLRKFMRFLYINYIKKGEFLGHWEKCWTETYSLHADIKAFLNMMHIER
ncbi:hypothetical protein HYT56_02540 [Candidatus Woesearchaeota archaeon]|nr:hypothetical protein [Candidatus Woesearchaeota archaeon]